MKHFRVTSILCIALSVMLFAGCATDGVTTDTVTGAEDTLTDAVTVTEADDTAETDGTASETGQDGTETATDPVTETDPAETTGTETTAADTTGTESDTAETTQEETTAPETKPAETKPAETKPAETKPAETKPAETKPAETTAEPAQTDAVTEEVVPEEKELAICTPGEKRSSFVIVYDKDSANQQKAAASMLAAVIRNHTGVSVATAESSKTAAKEIILSSSQRNETAEMKKGLKDGEYAVRAVRGSGSGEGKLLIACTTYESAFACAEFLMDNYYDEKTGFRVPFDVDVKGSGINCILTESGITKKVRDPFVLVDDGVYYVYGTGWKCFKNTSGKLDGKWKKTDIEVTLANPDTDGGSHWAPEVHKYNGAYYMFTTYLNSATQHRGCVIFKADSPEGPFTDITNGHITPASWDCIDGTFYVDPDGQPWMVFVHEWTSMKDNVGSFAAAKLSDDLTHFISEPIELFKANEPIWAQANITDGCFMYTTKNGDLLMLWSNFDAAGYAIGVARSSNGRLDGEWIHEKDLIYSKYMTNVYDGGHGMIFTGVDGQMYAAFHSPNTATDDRKEMPVFIALEEKDGRIVRKTSSGTN